MRFNREWTRMDANAGRRPAKDAAFDVFCFPADFVTTQRIAAKSENLRHSRLFASIRG